MIIIGFNPEGWHDFLFVMFIICNLIPIIALALILIFALNNKDDKDTD